MNYQEKIRRINFVLCSVFLLALPTRSQTLSWARQIGGTLNDEGYAVAVDASGNVYTTGYFNGTVDFDPGPGTANLTSNGAEDIFITKMNASGNIVWAKNMGGATAEYGRSIAVDASGNIYCTGSFTGTGDFDPGPSTYNLTSAGSSDIFICKLSSSGDLLWAQRY